MNYPPITVGKIISGNNLTCKDPKLAPFLRVPEFAEIIADELERQGVEINASIDDEIRNEIIRNVDRNYSEDTYVPGLQVDNSEADALILEAVATEDPVARRDLTQQAQQIRVQNSIDARLEAREAARANALEREFDRLGQKDREAQREQSRTKARLLLAAAAQIRGAVSGEAQTNETLLATSWALDRHACIFGAIGSGKTRLAMHLIKEQLRAGCSLIAIDPKSESVHDLVSCAISAGVAPEDVILIKPGADASIPGWNPFLGDAPPEEMVQAIYSFFNEITGLGDRMDELLRNALNVLAAHKLSLYEVKPLITSETYRMALLEREPPSGRSRAYLRAVKYFKEEFERRNESGREETVQALNNRLSTLLDITFFAALLCSNRNTLDLATLWRQQKVVIVYLDQQSLGAKGSRIVGGLLAYQAYLTASKVGPSSDRSVVMALDEIGAQEKFLGQYLSDIVTVARSRKLRMLIATQDFSRISPLLLDALLNNGHFRVFFQIGEADAKRISGTFAATTLKLKDNAKRLEVSSTGLWHDWELELCGPDGSELSFYEPIVEEVPFVPQAPVEARYTSLPHVSIATEIGYEDLSPPCPQPISPTLAPKPPVFTPPSIPPALLQKLQRIDFLRAQAEAHNRKIQNQTISRFPNSPTLLQYGYATFDEQQLEDGGIEYRFYSVDGTKKEESALELQLDKILAYKHEMMFGAQRTRKPLTDQFGMTERSEQVILTPNDLKWKQLLDEYNSKENERQAAIEKYNAEVAQYQTQVYQRNEEIRQWQVAANNVLAQLRQERRHLQREHVDHNAQRYQEALANHEREVAAAQARSAAAIQYRLQAIQESTEAEFADYPLLAEMYVWLRTTYDSSEFHVWINEDEHIDLAELVPQFVRMTG